MNSDFYKLFIRIGFSAMMIPHGIAKIHLLNSANIQFADPIGVGETFSLILTLIAEILCPLLIILGIKVRWSSIPVIITMAVAAFVIHGDDPWSKKEMALLYLIGFTAIALMGSGKYAIRRD